MTAFEWWTYALGWALFACIVASLGVLFFWAMFGTWLSYRSEANKKLRLQGMEIVWLIVILGILGTMAFILGAMLIRW